MVNPDAAFDVLAITRYVEGILGNVAYGEFHLFAYLACLLSLYRRRPVTDWGYEFAGTREGSPFSHQIAEAVETLERSGLLTQEDRLFRSTDEGAAELEGWRTLGRNRSREEFLSGACSSALALPVGLLRTAMGREPSLSRAADVEGTRPLLERRELETLYAQFEVLSRAIGVEVEELSVPAVIWLTYLAQIAEGEYGSGSGS